MEEVNQSFGPRARQQVADRTTVQVVEENFVLAAGRFLATSRLYLLYSRKVRWHSAKLQQLLQLTTMAK